VQGFVLPENFFPEFRGIVGGILPIGRGRPCGRGRFRESRRVWGANNHTHAGGRLRSFDSHMSLHKITFGYQAAGSYERAC
jgi:hypothetical protein